MLKVTKSLKGATEVISHGIDKKFFLPPRPQKIITKFSSECPFQVLYVSTIEPYKHHHQVIDAAAKVYDKGFPLVLNLIGPGNSNELNQKMLYWYKIPRPVYIYCNNVNCIHNIYYRSFIAFILNSVN